MTHYTIYNDTGHITEQFEGSENILQLNISETEGFIEGWFDADEFYIEDGQPVAKAPKPGPLAEFDYVERVWISKTAEELAAAKHAGLEAITRLRGQARLAYITDLPGQDMLYMAKMEEARAYIADDDPDPADFPLIASEVGVTAPTADEVAQVFLNLNAMWRQAAGQIDAACFQAEGAVMAAPNIATVTAIVAGLRDALAA